MRAKKREYITTQCISAEIKRCRIFSSFYHFNIFLLHYFYSEYHGLIYHWNCNSESQRSFFQEQAWELLVYKPWHRDHRNTDRGLAKAGKHESGVQWLKVAQIFTTQSTIQNLYLLYCTLSFQVPSVRYFLNGFLLVVGVVMLLQLYP